MKHKYLIALPLVMLLSGCNLIKNLIPSKSKEESSFSSEQEHSSNNPTSTTSILSEEPSEDPSEDPSEEPSSDDYSSDVIEGNWPTDIADAMDEYVGERLPYAPLNEETITYSVDSYPDSGFTYFSVWDDNEYDVLENYGLLLLDCGYTEDYTVCTKINSRGQELQVVFGYIEADEGDDYESGNSIDVYIYDNVDDSSSSNSSEDSSDDSDQSQEPAEIITETYDFTGTTISDGSHLDDSTPMEKLYSYMNKDSSYVTDIVATKCDFKAVPFDDNGRTVLCVGTGSYAGAITFTFTHQIQQISLVLQGYYKYIAYYDSYSMDANAKIYVNDFDEPYNLGSTDENPPEKVTVDITFDELTNQISLYNLDAAERSYVFQMDVTMVVF